MLLRASSELSGDAVDVAAVTSGAQAVSGVPHQDVLVAFAEAVVGDDAALPAARDALRAAMGPAALVDAAAVAGNFQRMVRIADGAGIPLDTPVAMATAALREQLGIDDYPSAAQTPPLGRLQRLAGRALARVLPRLMAAAARRSRP